VTDYKRKLIEVSLPLEAINRESAREKSIRHGHPSTLHLWWARRPLATCRAVLFASLVDDPSSHPETFPTEEAQEEERERLFRIIEELVLWENSDNEAVLSRARAEIMKSCEGNPPVVLDPFCGGGSIPLEAQRLGLEARGSDLNPVAVLITKALVEIPPKFADLSPVHPLKIERLTDVGWKGAQGLAEDVQYYGQWMRDEAERRIGHLYPKVVLPKECGGGEATVIAWLWTRTVKCPNPACGAEMPLVRSFALSTKRSKRFWVEPVVDRVAKAVRFEVRSGPGVPPEGTVNRQGARCVVCESAVPFTHVRAEGKGGRMGSRLMAIVAEGKRERAFLSPDERQVRFAESAEPKWKPEADLPHNPRDFKTPNYGLTTFADLFTPRQLLALTTFSDLVEDAREMVLCDALTAGMSADEAGLDEGGTGAAAYADAVVTYLGLVTSRSANTLCTLALWSQSRDQTVNAFSRQALPMTWDFPEVNPFAGAAGDFGATANSMARSIAALPIGPSGIATQLDARNVAGQKNVLVATDPPYYDNIAYADLSDFFYIWLRSSLSTTYPDLFSTLLVPKRQELVATPYRFGGDKKRAEEFFRTGLGEAFERMRDVQDPAYPLTVYYAFKQAETDGEDNGNALGHASTGWETMLQALLEAGLTIEGTWPMRTERPTGMKVAMNALASSIVLVSRVRSVESPLATRKEFIGALRRELPDALRRLQHGNIAPVDLAQATIGPGMAIFSRYLKVLEPDGTAMRVRTALSLINQALDEVLAEQEGEYDADTRWSVSWFDQFGLEEKEYGLAETLATAKGTTVAGLLRAGIAASGKGKARLLSRDELQADWDPMADRRLTVWEVAQHLIRALEIDGEQGAANLLRQIGYMGETARDLAYRLYLTCERKKWASEALTYNSLVVAWPEISRLAAGAGPAPGPQTLF
jgi:putative DNA methylase